MNELLKPVKIIDIVLKRRIESPGTALVIMYEHEGDKSPESPRVMYIPVEMTPKNFLVAQFILKVVIKEFNKK